MNRPLPPLEWDPVTLQLKGFARGLAEIQWLLVALVLLYLVFLANDGELALAPLAATGAYFAFSLATNYLSLFRVPQRWALAVQTWVMIGFITWLIHETGDIDSPLVGLYLLAVITGALTLGKLTTVLEVAAIAACYSLLLYDLRGLEGFVGPSLGIALGNLLMFLLVGYLTTVLADAIHFANARLRQLASTDELTGLYNRAAFAAFAKSLFATAARYDRALSVLLIDVDDLKSLNDEFGHARGDQAIATAGSRLAAIMRKSDIAARYAGDEFVAILPETTAAGAVKLAERLLVQATAEPFAEHELTLSIGVASFPEHGDDVETLLERADQAMYRSKRQGGSRVTVYDAKRRSFQVDSCA